MVLISLVGGNVAAQQNDIDLNFQSVKLRDAFRALADVANMNIVTDSSVKGTTTVHLENTSFREAVDLLAKSSGLEYRIVNNTILVAAPGKLQQGFGKKVTRVFKLKNSDPSEVKKSINLLVNDKALRVDKRTSSLIVTAYQSKLPEIERTIKQLDQEKYQVIIQARIEEISHGGLEKLGIDWNFQELTANGNTATIIDKENDVNSGGGNVAQINGGDIALDYLTMINMLEKNNQATNLANPQITTIDGKKATINIGEEVPIVKPGGDGLTKVEFRDVGIILDITPKVTEDNKIYMDVKPETSTVEEYIEAGGGEYPVINTKKVQTNVRVKSGETIAIGGLISKDEIKRMKKVPFLSDVPLFGKIFENERTETEKRELVIFLTPKIVKSTPQISQNKVKLKTFNYEVKSGDSVWSIGNLFDISFAKILEYNNIQYVSDLKTGQEIKIPVPKTHYYEVKSDDNLVKIAEKYNVKVSVIKKINNLSSLKEKAGTEIVLPVEIN